MLARDLNQCTRCGELITERRAVCDCGTPTRWMTFEERSRHEVEQWRLHRAKQAEATS
jgi:uncharacterized OB-fold protein